VARFGGPDAAVMPRRLSTLAGALLVLLALGCRRVPTGRSAVDDVTVLGARRVHESEVKDRIATTTNPKFLGLFPGVLYDYSVFDRHVLERDLARVEAFYRSRGFYDVHARAGRVFRLSDNHVRVEILVEEGEPVRVRTLRVDGLSDLPPVISGLARRAATEIVLLNKPFEEEAFDKAKEAVRRALTDRGYAYAKVESEAAVDLATKQVDVILTAHPGEKQVFGPVTIEGLESLPEKPVRRTVDIDAGAPYSEAALDAARQAILDLGVFSSAEVRPELSDPPSADHVVPVKVVVVPSRLRTIRLGGGFELDALKTDIHGVVGWQSRNFFGGLRSFSSTFSPGVVLFPTRINHLVFPQKLLPEGKIRIDFKQPGFLEARTNLFIRPYANVQALLFDTNPPPDEPVIGYAETKNSIGLERSYGRLYAAISYTLQVAYPFAYVGPRDPTLGTVLISYPSIVTQLDFRDDRVHPKRGIWLGNTFEAAGGPFGGMAGDVKVQPEVRGYVPVARGVVLAARGSVGFLFARNYGAIIQDPFGVFETPAQQTLDYQLTFFRGFFSGGPNSNRGYPARGVGPQAIVPFISPAVEAQRLATSCTGNFDCRTPTGGFTLWELSVEARFRVTGPLSVATFCDSSDVSPRQVDIRPKHLHLSCGAGGRYDTPVGPVRLDVGVRIPGLQVIGGLTFDERQPDTFPFGLPIAIALGIGEAY
jgi:outer membrane protein insertion porin family/translocation and assembly module TamA